MTSIELVSTPNLVTSGLPALDEKLGGLPVGRIALLHGAPRTGKTWCALAVAREAIERGGRCLYVTSDEPATLCALAERSLGFDLRSAVSEGSMVLIGPGQWFTHKLRSLGGAERALDELGKLVWSRGLDTVVFDSFDVVLAAAELALVKRFVRGAVASLSKLSATCLLTSLGLYSPELVLAAQELATCVPTVVALGEGEPCTAMSVHASWTDVESIPVEMVCGFGPVMRELRVVTTTSTRASRSRPSHLRVA